MSWTSSPRTCGGPPRRRSSRPWCAGTATSARPRTRCRRRCWRRPGSGRRGRARRPGGLADHGRLAAADRPGAVGAGTHGAGALAGCGRSTRRPATGRATATTRWRCCCSAATRRCSGPPGRPHPARRRRSDHRPDRAGVPGPRSHDGPADQPGQVPAAPAGRPVRRPPPASCRPAWPRSPRCCTWCSPRATRAPPAPVRYDVSLAEEAMRLTRRLHALLPSDPEISRPAGADAADRRAAGVPHVGRRLAHPPRPSRTGAAGTATGSARASR